MESMSELSAATWHDIEAVAVSLPSRTEKFVSLGALRTVLRKSRRTTEQNKLLWALYDDAIKQGGEALGGWDRKDVHEFLLGEYWGWDECTALGRTRLKPKKRSSRLTKNEFSDFVAFVVQKFAEHGVVLELPEDPTTQD
jgi:hypothetical protein